MAKASGTDPAGFDSQLATTHLFGTPAEAYAFATGEGVVKTMTWCAASPSTKPTGTRSRQSGCRGIQFPGGKILGDPGNVKMRFDSKFTQMAQNGQL